MIINHITLYNGTCTSKIRVIYLQFFKKYGIMRIANNKLMPYSCGDDRKVEEHDER